MSPYFCPASEGQHFPILEDPISRSPVHYEDLGHLTYFGKIPGKVMVNKKSSLYKPKMAKSVENIFIKNNYFPTINYLKPRLKPGMSCGKYVYPFNVALRTMNNEKKGLNPSIAKLAIKEYTDFIIRGLDENNTPKWQPIDLETAVNGAKHDDFLRRVKATSSAGFGLTGVKGDHLPIVEDDIREPTSELKQMIIDTINILAKDETSNPIFIGCLKDEPRPEAKVIAGKTRVFYAGTTPSYIVERMFLSPLYTSMVELNEVYCTSVGINMHANAGHFYHNLVDFSPFIMEGDYSSFDLTIPPDVSRAVNTIVCNVLEHQGYTEETMKVVRSLLTDKMFPFLSINGDLFGVPGLQTSGKYGTAEDNSMKGVYMLIYAWYSLGLHLKYGLFFDFNRPNTYGDDVNNAVKEECKEDFNNCVYQLFCKEVYSMGFTSALKTMDMLPFNEVKDMSFLKRKFVERNNEIIAPLDMNSIYRSLQWSQRTVHMNEEQQQIATSRSALWELYFHYDSKQHSSFRKDLIDVICETYESPRSEVEAQLPTWETVYDSLHEE
jgi:hypothetical protein